MVDRKVGELVLGEEIINELKNHGPQKVVNLTHPDSADEVDERLIPFSDLVFPGRGQITFSPTEPRHSF